MHTNKKDLKPNYFLSVFTHKCSRCRTGDMFQTKKLYNLKQFMKMYTRCPVCDQFLEIEPGFYYGTSYVSYMLTVALSVATFIAWWVIIGLSLHDNRLFWWIGFNTVVLILCQPYLMRLSRAMWLSFFVKYNANWQTERPEEPERR
ncbi:MAG TPA: DUF983 domain-containing protein [Puia sp.]